jgi:micrococcal nuclease
MPEEINLWRYQARIVRWIDGDTVDLDVDVGFYIGTKQRVRLLGSKGGVNCYELHASDPKTREAAELGAAYSNHMAPPGAAVFVITDKAKGSDPKDGFGRFLARIVTQAGEDVGDALLGAGLAVPYVRG